MPRKNSKVVDVGQVAVSDEEKEYLMRVAAELPEARMAGIMRAAMKMAFASLASRSPTEAAVALRPYLPRGQARADFWGDLNSKA